MPPYQIDHFGWCEFGEQLERDSEHFFYLRDRYAFFQPLLGCDLLSNPILIYRTIPVVLF